MFKWLNKQGVESDKGFIVQCTGRFTLEYVEGSRKIIIDVEHGWSGGKHIDSVRAENFERWSNGWPIDREKQKEIKRNFVEAMAFQNIRISIEDDPDSHYLKNNLDIILETKLKTSLKDLK